MLANNTFTDLGCKKACLGDTANEYKMLTTNNAWKSFKPVINPGRKAYINGKGASSITLRGSMRNDTAGKNMMGTLRKEGT